VNYRRFRLDGGQQRPLEHQHPIFVVFGTQRSGSTLVASRLNSHPCVICYEEVLLPSVDSEPSLRQWLIENQHPRWSRILPSRRESFLNSVVETDPGPGVKVVGMKIMYDQVSLWPKLSYMVPSLGKAWHDVRLLQWMKNNQVLVVHTLRRNHLKMLTSHTLAARTGRFHSRDAAQKSALSMISLPLHGLIPRLRRIETAEKVARDAIQGLSALEVWYEDYVGPEGQEIEAQLCAAIGVQVPDAGLRSPLAKVTSDNLQDTLANYDDVVRHLSGTRFERFLNE
jgi:LPS sulfotransferase NodH